MEIAGRNVSPPVVIAGIGGVAIVLFLYKRGQSSSPSSSAVDPATGLPASMDSTVDPVTGMTYLAEAEQYGSVSAAEAQASNGLVQGGSDTSGYVGTAGQPATGVSFSSASQQFATDAAWAQAAQAGLAQIGYDPVTVGNAIGAYLNRKPLTTDQAQIVQAAVAEFGPPPVGQYSIVPQGTSSGGGVGSTGHPELPAPGHVHVTNKTAHEFSLAWNPVHGANGYRVQVKQTNNKVIADFEVPGPGCTVSANTHPGYTYHVGIQALPGGHGTNITVSLPSK